MVIYESLQNLILNIVATDPLKHISKNRAQVIYLAVNFEKFSVN